MSRREGYLIVDHRASPGIPADLAQQIGLDPAQCGEGKVMEAATLTCSHCKCAVMKNPLRTRERPYCSKCDHYICDICAAAAREPGYSHLPYEQMQDLIFDYGAKGIVLGTPQEIRMAVEKKL